MLQAASASAKVLNGDPITLTAPLREWSGRHVARKPRRPWKPGPSGLANVMTNEMSALLALHRSKYSTARWNCRDVLDNPTHPRTPTHQFGILTVKCDDFGFANFGSNADFASSGGKRRGSQMHAAIAIGLGFAVNHF